MSDWKPGDIANGHVLGDDLVWRPVDPEPVADPVGIAPPPPPPPPMPTTTTSSPKKPSFAERMEASQAKTQARLDALTGQSADRKAAAQTKAWEREHKGWQPMPALTCPHCETTGQVIRDTKKVKSGTSRGKIAGGVLTGGLSLAATGLAKKTDVLVLACRNCTMDWTAGTVH